jgi:hypothetical protein
MSQSQHSEPEAEAGEETLDQMYQTSAGCLGDLTQKILGLTVQSTLFIPTYFTIIRYNVAEPAF